MWTLEGEAGQRALMAWAMGWDDAIETSGGNDWMAPWLAHLMVDPYDVVRLVSERSLRRVDGYKAIEYDFMAPRAELAGVSKSIFSHWSAQPPTRTDPELVLDEQGAIRLQDVGEMAKLRDDRRINLLE